MEREIYTPHGKWWRFDRYEIRDGYIRPAPKAELVEFNPWEGWRAFIKTQGTTKLNRLCVGPFVGIAGPLGYGAMHRKNRDITKGSERLILDWVEENGLLGLLLHRVEYIRLAARWSTGQQLIDDTDRGKVPGPPATWPTHKWYRRGPHSWSTDTTVARTNEDFDRRFPRRFQPELNGSIVPPEVLHRASIGGRVHLRALDRGVPALQKIRIEGISPTWTRYFPSVPESDRENLAYPQPLTEAFWRMYQEPVKEFLECAASLAEVIDGLVGEQTRRLRLNPADRAVFQFDCDELNSLVRPVQPELLIDRDGSLTQTWAFPSLLSALAMMTLLQLTEAEGRVIGVCVCCRSPFVSGDARAIYCTDKCRRAIQKRRYRSKRLSGSTEGELNG